MKFQISSRRIWAISYPVILAGLSEKIVEITDTIFLARYGIVELGAVALADATFEVAIFLTVGLAEGIQIFIARRAGQGRNAEIGHVFNQGLWVLSALSIVLMVLIRFASPWISDWVTSSDAVGTAVDDFLRIIAFAVVFHSANMAFSAFYVGISRTAVLIGATATLAVTNIALDYCLIFGHFGFPRLGIEGAAIASLAAEIAAFAFLFVFTLAKTDLRKYRLFRFTRWDVDLIGRLTAISSPVAIEVLLDGVRWFVFFVIIERLGAPALAMANIVYSCYGLFVIPIDGFAETACSMVSNLVGQGKARTIWALLRRAMTLGTVVVLPILAVSAWLPEVVLWIFTPDDVLVEGSIGSLRVIVLAVMMAIPAEMIASAVTGTGDTTATFVIELISTVAILSCAYVAAIQLQLPLAAVWASELVGVGLTLGLAYYWLRSRRWQRLHI